MTNKDVGLDTIDGMVYTETVFIRRRYIEACRRLGLPPRTLTPPQIGMRSVR